MVRYINISITPLKAHLLLGMELVKILQTHFSLELEIVEAITMTGWMK